MTKEHITGEHPVVAEVRMARPYRAALVVAFLCFAVATLIASLVIIGPAREAAQHSAATETAAKQAAKEADCRNTIASVLADAGNDLNTSLAHLILTASDPLATDEMKTEARDEYSVSTTRNQTLSDIRGDAVTVCHNNPSYRLPDVLTSPGGTPP